jgi:signal transduction histidine kinase/CHASE3 domain sensor protein
MAGADRSFWKPLPVQQKVWTILLVVFVPLIAALVVHVVLLNKIQILQQQHHQNLLAREQIRVLRRLAVDIENAFRGYLLTQQEQFLKPLRDAVPQVQPAVDQTLKLVADSPDLGRDLRSASDQLTALMASKQDLIEKIRAGHAREVLEYVRSGQGLALSDALRDRFRSIEDRMDRRSAGFEAEEAGLVRLAFWGLVLAVTITLAFGLLHGRLLSRSITGPIVRLQGLVSRLSGSFGRNGTVQSPSARAGDEIEQLIAGFVDMAGRIRRYLRELEALQATSHEINIIRSDGLYGALRRITDRAVELLQVDVCMVMLRTAEMGCWVVEAASGEWADALQKAVMLWEEFPVSVQAFETKEPVIGEDLQGDERPQVQRRNLIGRSMLSVPLLSQGEPFGVLVLLMKQQVPREWWNVRLARGFADEVAVAIVNARLYEAAHSKGKGLESRLKELEHLAVTLAHDMKGPGERMWELAANLGDEYGEQLDERAKRWLRLMVEEGKDLAVRIESIFEVARVGVRPDTLEAVDPAAVLADILKHHAGELERRRVRVAVPDSLPVVACHHAYVRQVLDNLISNAVKFCDGRAGSEIRITARTDGPMVFFSISDNGPGIPPQHRERVFEPFARLHPGGAKGSGIGLTIVKRIVELYGGRVWIEPQGPPGCTVTFSLPLLVARTASLPDAEREGVRGTS